MTIITALKRFSTSYFMLAALFALFLITLKLMSDISADMAKFERFAFPLLLFNSIAAALLIIAIVGNVAVLVWQVWRRHAGSKLTLKLVFLVTIITLAPVAAVYGFAINALNTTIESFFDVKVDKALQDSVRLSNTAIDVTLNHYLNFTRRLAREFSNVDEFEYMAIVIERLRQFGNASELTLFNYGGHVIASAGRSVQLIPNVPADSVFQQLKLGRSHASIDTIDETTYIRIAVNVPRFQKTILYALYPIPDNIRSLRNAIGESAAAYARLADIRNSLKHSFIVNLSLTLLLTVLSALLTAIKASRRFTAPIHQLADATHTIAAGNYDVVVPTTRQDDFGVLVRAFNAMVRKVAQSNRDIRASQALLETRNRYLAALLANMSSGVLSTDSERRLTAYNQAAEAILGVRLADFADHEVFAIAERHPHMLPLLTMMRETADHKRAQEVIIDGPGGKQTLIAKVRTQSGDDVDTHTLLVFDDITALVQAQREAAWSEVARRMAHEIRNPLTPIQLATERLRRKYLAQLPADEQQQINKLTQTIIEQVDSIKTMVTAFAAYAKAPPLQKASLDLHALITEVVTLFQVSSATMLQTELLATQYTINGDDARIRQLLNNLLKNALEALDGRDDGTVIVRTANIVTTALVITVCDNGPGIGDAIKHAVFEPYISSKPGGTGLGLAICKRIVEEHEGTIAVDSDSSGTTVTVTLPLDKGSVLQ